MSLLGPAGPEIGCDECFERLDEYVESRAVPGMEAHLEGCPACREEYESLLALVRDDG
jgi:predicted anti-sigma-YlaC factor YlaD